MLYNVTESHKNRLGSQPYPELVEYSRLNLIFQRDNLSRGGATAIDDRQRMLARDASRAFGIALGESGVLDQPSRRQFAKSVRRGIAGHLQPACFQTRRELFEE